MRRNFLVLLAAFLLGTVLGCGDNIPAPDTIASVVVRDARFSSLENVLRDAGLLETLDGPDSYTLFAFTDDGFERGDVGENQLLDFAAYHVHEGVLGFSDLESQTAASTLHGTEIHIRNGLNGLLLNDGVLVDTTPIVTDNGIIHVLDRMLSRTLITSVEEFKSSPDAVFDFGVSDTIELDREGFIHNLQIAVDIEQRNVSNIFLFLEHPETGTFVRLVENTRTSLSNMRLTFADSAELDVERNAERGGDDPAAEAYPAGRYRAFEPLEYFVGEPIAGEWELFVFNFGGDEEDGEGVLRSWSMHAAIGDEMPAPALVLNPRRPVPRTFGQRFTETAVVEARQVGGLVGEPTFAGSLGDLESTEATVSADARVGAILFDVPEDAEPGSRRLSLAAQIGDVSRMAVFEAPVVTPQSVGIELRSQLPLPRFDAVGATGNDIWGWTDPDTGAEIAIMGTSINAAFVDVSEPASPVILGLLPTASGPAVWRDMKVYQDHVFVVSEADEHGMQVFDLRQLRGVSETQTFTATARVNDFGAAHNLFINEDSGLAYVVGSDFEGCDGGILVYDISTPTSPVAIECFSGGVTNGQAGGPSYPTDVYTHDIQCVIYQGPDTDYQGRELCFSADEDSIAIADFTDPANPSQIVRVTYDSSGYTHQGWLTEDHEFFVLNDEFDEFVLGIQTRSYVFDMRDLDSPKIVHFIDNPSNAVGHNTYISDDIAYMANYSSGVRLVDLSNLDSKDTPELAYYDTNPDDDNICQFVDRCGESLFDGAWSNYPFFESGTILVSDTLRGLFVLERTSN